MLVFLTAFGVSLVVTLLVVHSAKTHRHFSLDVDASRP
jgi:hypothetical protein